jgi:hypothetical protein
MTASDIKTAPIEAASVQTPVATASMFSPEAEKLLIATVLNEGKKQIAEQLLAKIGSNDFHIDEHAAIWKSVQSLHENQLGHDAVALIDHARGSRSFVGGAEYIFNLVEDQTLRSLQMRQFRLHQTGLKSSQYLGVSSKSSRQASHCARPLGKATVRFCRWWKMTY